MTKLKQKILASLFNDAQLERTLSDLPNYQQNLLKNHTNNMLNKTEKNRVLKAYTDLSEINKSLNRYNSLKQGNYLEDAQEQKEEISDIVLKGGISNYKYIWHSEQGEQTCEKCKALDGTVYELWDEIPECPHPNCKCYIEVIEADEEQDTSQKELPSTQTKQEPENNKTWIMPCYGPIVGKYGEQRSTHVHNGIDIAVPIGTPIKAIADGTVLYAGANDPKGYGIYVIITHINEGKIVTSEYGHLSSINVRSGQQIKKGDIIAKSGNTGHSHGPHLHITIREGRYKGTPVNPNKYLDY